LPFGYPVNIGSEFISSQTTKSPTRNFKLRRPTTDDRRPTTDDRRPTTDDRRPTTDL